MSMERAGHGMFTRHELSPQEAKAAAKRVREQQEADEKTLAELMKMLED